MNPNRSLVEHVGGEDGPARLYARHGLSLYALAFGIVSDPLEAEQAVQETLAEPGRPVAGDRQPAVYRWLAARVRSRALGAVRARAWPPRPQDAHASGGYKDDRMIRTLIVGVLVTAGAVRAQTPQVPNAHPSDTATANVAEHRHHPPAKHYRGRVDPDRTPNATMPAVHASRATPATPAYGEGPTTPAVPAKPAIPAVPGSAHRSSGGGPTNSHRP